MVNASPSSSSSIDNNVRAGSIRARSGLVNVNIDQNGIVRDLDNITRPRKFTLTKVDDSEHRRCNQDIIKSEQGRNKYIKSDKGRNRYRNTNGHSSKMVDNMAESPKSLNHKEKNRNNVIDTEKLENINTETSEETNHVTSSLEKLQDFYPPSPSLLDSNDTLRSSPSPGEGSIQDDPGGYTLHPDNDAGNAIKIDNNQHELERTQCRFMSKTGRYLVKHHQKSKGLTSPSFLDVKDFFTTFVDMKWRWTLISFASFFIFSWLFFALLYYAVESYYYNESYKLNSTSAVWGKQCVDNVGPNNSFTGMFLFSLETQTTIGYGYRAITANCPFAIIILIVQSVIGCLIDAFTAGYIIAKFSRPKKRAATLLFSRNAVICQRDGKLCLMFRVGNLRKSLLVEATIRMLYISEKKTIEGEIIPLDQQPMNLDLGGDSEKILLVTPQIVCHPIDMESPLDELSKSQLDYLAHKRRNSECLMNSTNFDKFDDFEIIVVLEGQVESTGMTMQARVSYTPNEIKWDQCFTNILNPGKNRSGYKVNFKDFHETKPTKRPDEWNCSAADRRKEETEDENTNFFLNTQFGMLDKSIDNTEYSQNDENANNQNTQTKMNNSNCHKLVSHHKSNNARNEDENSSISLNELTIEELEEKLEISENGSKSAVYYEKSNYTKQKY